jgi:6-phosphogluconolactonase
MRLELLEDEPSAARATAAFIAEQARAAVASRGRFVMAVSGGHTPWRMLTALSGEDVPWAELHIAQVDERVAPSGDPARNATHLAEALLARAPVRPQHVHLMEVEAADLDHAAARYARTLAEVAGAPPTLDLVHLGLGPDGHTASLVPGDPVLKVTDADTAVTRPYQGHRRMTLTYPALNRARRVLWLVTGADKVEMLPRLQTGDASIPAGRVRRDEAVIFADAAAARAAPTTPA